MRIEQTSRRNPYAANKALWHPDRIVALARGEQPAPVHLNILPTNLCNNACTFCAYRMPDYISAQRFDRTSTLPTWKIIEILEDAKAIGVKAIQFTGGGEPLIHPDIEVMMRVALALGFEVALVTNGLKLKPGMLEVLIRCSWIRVSLDAGSAEVHNVTHRPPDLDSFSRTVSNIKQLVQARNAASSNLYIGVGYVVAKENWRDILRGARLAKDMGVDNIRIAAAFTTEGDDYFSEFSQEMEGLAHEAEELTDDSFFVSNNVPTRRADLAMGHPDYEFCPYQHLTTYLAADMNVYRCCVLGYNDRGLLGSLNGRHFDEFWFSEEKQSKMRDFSARSCPYCQFGDRNREINALIGSFPLRHGNFT